jgi:hypothetical protein
MHTKAVVVSVLAAGCTLVTAQEPTPAAILHVRESNGDHNSMPNMPNLKTVDPAKLSAYHSDMHSLRSKIKHDTMYTKMKEVMKTAVPQSYKDAMATNAASVQSQFKASAPGWYQSLPTDVRSFMDGNRQAAKSVYEKDISPVPTDSPYPGGGYMGGTGGRNDGNLGFGPNDKAHGGKDNKDAKKDDKKKSEGPGLSAVGAAAVAMVGAFGLAALLL